MARFAQASGQLFDRGERMRLGGFFAAVALLHVAGVGCLLLYGTSHPAFLGLGVLAYTFGLRHAFDADHISAIDNTTRKLLQQHKRPVGAGFFFSLGHSTVVLAIALLLALAIRTVVQSAISGNGELHRVGGLIGTSVSGLFLLVIGVLNLLVLFDVLGVYRRMRKGRYDRDALREELVAGGMFSRLFGWLFKFVGESWQLYPIGVLFGLGFDTATEVALLGVSAGAASKGLPFLAVISLPLLFAAGMSLMDTADGAFMSKAYAWAFSNPIRKVFYNLTITSLSVFVALFVGLYQVVTLLTDVVKVQGGFWDVLGGLDFEMLGFVIVGAFVVTWVASFAYFKLGRVEERWSATVPVAAPPGEGD
ncbi:MAG: HoxN/HupN/NixA family nickel/cobalt transporter [Candidatus Dormibacteraeota bacterium]|nr:HoxN/HupN/NixA family nickel/cobalt transporter [Candidatus Dormibacteraeota bacterium]